MTRAKQRHDATQSQIGVLVPQDIKRRIDARAASEGLSLSHYCARILTAALEAEEAAA